MPLHPGNRRSNVAEDLRGCGGVFVTPTFGQLIRGIGQIKLGGGARKQGNCEGWHTMPCQT